MSQTWKRRPSPGKALIALFARTFSSCFQYRVTGLAGEAAFFAILSLPPLAFGLAGTIGFVADTFRVGQVDFMKQRVLDLAGQALTEGTVDEVVAPTLDDVLSGGRIDVVSIGFVLALWSGSRALNVFLDTISIMYGLGGERGIIKTRALSFLLYLIALVIGIVLVPLILAGPQLAASAVPDQIGLLERLYWPIIIVLSIGFMASLYHLAIPVKKSWRSGLPGAVFTLSMWVVGSYLVRWVLGFSSGGMSIYGPLAAPIAVLLWLYVLSISILIGAAVNEAIDHHRHPSEQPELDSSTGGRGTGSAAAENSAETHTKSDPSLGQGIQP